MDRVQYNQRENPKIKREEVKTPYHGELMVQNRGEGATSSHRGSGKKEISWDSV